MKFKLQKFEDTYGNYFWRVYSKRWWFSPWECEINLEYFTREQAEAAMKEREDRYNYKYWKVDMDYLIDDNDRLKPCPFCGAEAEIITLEGETDEPSIGAQCVQCTSSKCGAASGLIYPLMGDVTHLLIERWNKRHNYKY